MVKVFLEPPGHLSQAMFRVSRALAAGLPKGYAVVREEDAADIVVLHVVEAAGLRDKLELLDDRKQQYVIIQYCLRSAGWEISEWLPIWQKARVVWSYYDLSQVCSENDLDFEGVNFYFAPLGVDAAEFRVWDVPKRFVIGTSGYVAESECVREAHDAAKALSMKMFHLGPRFEWMEDHVRAQKGMTDQGLAQQWSRCFYVAGLRRDEGFELPAAEGLLCGSRPVCFDKPHYRQWFGDFAAYIREEDPASVQQQLHDLFLSPYRPVTTDEIFAARIQFDWTTIAAGFWERVITGPQIIHTRQLMSRYRVLWCGDAVAATGFAKVTHGICDTLRQQYDVHVLGLNYFGDPHSYPYPIYPASGGGKDSFGIRRIGPLITQLRPDMVVVLNDPWNIPKYLKQCGNAPTIGFLAVDGKNCRGSELNGLKVAAFWTQFAMNEARRGGFTGNAAVIPLGVDLSVFSPMSQQEARRSLPFSSAQLDSIHRAFIVGNVNRNQPRKRLDQTISIFAEWIKAKNIRDAYLLLHVTSSADLGFDIPQLLTYYEIANRAILIEPEASMGIPESEMRNIYAACDVMFTTTQGEGWGLPTMEAMACGVPTIAPDWAALGEWAKDAAILVSVSDTICTPNGINAVGGLINRSEAIRVLDSCYSDRSVLQTHSKLGLALVGDSHYRWENIGSRMADVIDFALSPVRLRA